MNLLPKRSSSVGIEARQQHAIYPNSVVVSAKEQVSCKLGEEFAVLELTRGRYYGLKRSAADLWRLLQDGRSWIVGELRDSITEKREAIEEREQADLIELLEKMRSCGLIEVQDANRQEHETLRRQFVTADTLAEGSRLGSLESCYPELGFEEYGTIEDITRFNTLNGGSGDNRTKNNTRSGAG